MSRGLGRLQREVLAAIPDLGGAADAQTLAERIHGTPVSVRDARYEAVRRAVKSLERRGLIRQCEGRRGRVRVNWSDGSRSWRDQFEAVPR